jgi:uncharacterized SAM-binding protein YcdF (DUF218 family)
MSFILSKILWVFLSPGNLLVLLLVVGAFLGVSHSETRRRAGHIISFVVALLFFIIAIFPVGTWFMLPLENKYPPNIPDHVAGIILLGGDERPHAEIPGRPVYLDSARRYIEFATLARKYPQAKLAFSGGTPLLQANADMSEVAKQALAGLGVPVDKMVFEYGSRNTRENAVLSYNLIHPPADQKWVLVTSAYHMPRAIATFRKAGWNIYPATTGYLTDGVFSPHLDFNVSDHLIAMAWAVHEYYGLLDYWLMGYTDKLWPN